MTFKPELINYVQEILLAPTIGDVNRLGLEIEDKINNDYYGGETDHALLIIDAMAGIVEVRFGATAAIADLEAKGY